MIPQLNRLTLSVVSYGIFPVKSKSVAEFSTHFCAYLYKDLFFFSLYIIYILHYTTSWHAKKSFVVRRKRITPAVYRQKL